MKRPKNTRVVKSDYNPSTDDSSMSADEDSSTYYDSDSKEALERKKERANKNSNYTLKAGTIITFTPATVFVTNETVTVTITEIKPDWENLEDPLVVVPFELVKRSFILNTKGKNTRLH